MIRLSLTLAACAALLLPTVAGAAMDDMPKRKPGLWSMVNETSMMPGQKMQLQQCIDASTDDSLTAQSAEERKQCSKEKVWREGDRILMEAVCKHEGSTATMKGVFKGDFTKAYSGEIHTRYEPPLEGMKEARMKMEARHLGPCKPGQKPGDIEMSFPGMGGGGKINLEELMKNMPR